MKNEKELKAQAIAELTKVVSTTAFDQYIKDIEAKPKNQRVEFVKETANLPEMKKRGIPVTEGFRITVRSFENPDNPETLYDNKPINKIVSPNTLATSEAEEAGLTVCVSAGFVVCVSVGYSPN